MSFNRSLTATASLFAIAAAFPATAYAQDEATPAEQCASIANEAERLACLENASDDTATASDGGAAAALPPGAGQPVAEDGGIVVTGSRIRKSEFNSPDPIQIINPDIAVQQGQNQTSEIINSAPIASGSFQITSAVSNNFVTNGGADAQTVSLRGLGAERTLVLLNGRRAGPAGIRGAVSSFDLNVLPRSIVRQIEILKTGASSIYGSDAVAGVVNILTKKDTDGIEVDLFALAPFDGGGETFNGSLSYGKDFGRGHFLVTLDYFKRNDLRRDERSFFDCEEEFLTRLDGTRADLQDVRTGRNACNGVIGNLFLTNNDFSGALRAPNGRQLFIGQYSFPGADISSVGIPFNSRPGITAPANFFGLNFDGPSTGAVNQYLPLEQTADVLSELERYTAYVDASFEITPSVEIYAEGLYNKRKTYNDGFQQFGIFQFPGNALDLPGFFCDPTINSCNNADAGDPANAEFGGRFLLRPLVLLESDSSTDIEYYRGVLGLKGDFGSFLEGWYWDVYGQYSRSDADYFQNLFPQDRADLLEFRTRDCTGRTVADGTSCVNIDFTDPRVLSGDLTPEEYNYLVASETGNTVFEQGNVELVFSGTLINLPAGEVGVAMGANFRRDEIFDRPGDFTFNGNIKGRSGSGITAGSTDTKEVFGEVQIPLIYNTPFIQRLSLSGAARYTNVEAERRDGVTDNFDDTTWKVGVDWEVNDWLRFRGSWGTSFRAPALFELFLENQTGFLQRQNIDICSNFTVRFAADQISQRVFDNCSSQLPADFIANTSSATIISGGGIGNLRPETSEAKTLSLILTPDTTGILWGGLRTRIAVDYFDIEVDDQITTLGAANIITRCYTSDTFPTDPICSQFSRLTSGPAVDNIDFVRDTTLNINRQTNRGIDVTANLTQDLGNWGSFNLLAQMTWQIQDEIELFDDTILFVNGEDGEPKWTGDFNLSYRNGDWSAFWGIDVIGGTSNEADLRNARIGGGNTCRTSIFRPGLPFCPDTRLSPTFYHSASVSKRFGNFMFATVGVANLFDTAPPRASTTTFSGINLLGPSPVFGTQYDILGRRVFVNIRANF